MTSPAPRRYATSNGHSFEVPLRDFGRPTMGEGATSFRLQMLPHRLPTHLRAHVLHVQLRSRSEVQLPRAPTSSHDLA